MSRFNDLQGLAPTSAAPEVLGPFPAMRIGEMAALVDAAPTPRFVIRRLLVEGDYGVLAAEKKFGKSLAMADAAVNVAAGGSFLGTHPVDVQGPVLLFAGEGGRRKIVRRTRAIAAFYDHDHDSLPLHVYERAPKLANAEQVERLALTVAAVQPVLTIIDPGYLAISGAETSNLTSMGTLLERAQIVAQDAGSALLISHHWNKTGQGTGADRFTGTGFAEWGRVLMSGSTLSNNTDKDTGMTTRVCKLEVTGDEIGDTEILYRRRVWVDDPNDLASAMHYDVQIVEAADANATAAPAEVAGLKPAARRVLEVLRARAGQWMDSVQIGDVLAQTGMPLQKRTILEAGQALVEKGLASESGGTATVRKTFTAHTPSPNGGGNAL